MNEWTKPIIGTHNTMTYLRPHKWYGWFMIPFARCQRKTIEQQWEAGARCFDLRIRFDKGGEPYFAHGLYECTHKVSPSEVLDKISKLSFAFNQRVAVRLILEDPKLQNHNVTYFRNFCEAAERYERIRFFGGNRKGDWAQIVEFDYKPNLTQYVGSMMDDARWCEKIIPFAYALLRNKRGPQGDIAIYDYI